MKVYSRLALVKYVSGKIYYINTYNIYKSYTEASGYWCIIQYTKLDPYMLPHDITVIRQQADVYET